MTQEQVEAQMSAFHAGLVRAGELAAQNQWPEPADEDKHLFAVAFAEGAAYSRALLATRGEEVDDALRARVFESLDNAGVNGYDFRGCDAAGVVLDLQSYDADCDALTEGVLRPHVEAWLAARPATAETPSDEATDDEIPPMPPPDLDTLCVHCSRPMAVPNGMHHPPPAMARHETCDRCLDHRFGMPRATAETGEAVVVGPYANGVNARTIRLYPTVAEESKRREFERTGSLAQTAENEGAEAWERRGQAGADSIRIDRAVIGDGSQADAYLAGWNAANAAALSSESRLRDHNQQLLDEALESAQRESRLREAAEAVVDQWDAVLPSIQGAESMAHVHGWRYNGPEGGLKPQMDALRALLSTSRRIAAAKRGEAI